MEKKLELIFENVNNWLRFAEAKNALLLGFNGVIFFGIVRLLTSSSLNDVDILKVYFIIALVCLAFSSLITLLSFVPNLKILRPSFDFKQDVDNYLYFDVLRSKNKEDIINRYNNQNDPVTDYHNHLAEQIITNANITKRKYDYFTLGVWLSISAFLTPLLAAIFALYNYKS